MELSRIQEALREKGLDGWLFYDFHNRDLMGCRILGLDPKKFTSRRWYYLVPVRGEPQKLVSSVEKFKLDSLPGTRHVYLSWPEQHRLLSEILGSPPRRIAMQYSPMNNIPYVSVVDAGTMELVRSFGHVVVSSADLVQQFEARIGKAGYRLHLQARDKIERIKDQAFAEIGRSVRQNLGATEYDIQQFILRRFSEEKLHWDDPPIVGVNDHPADPHFEPTPQNARVMKAGDMVLIDLWAREDDPGAIFYDITWCGFTGENPPEKYVRIFDVVCRARDAAKDFVRKRFEQGTPCHGWEVDDACRAVVREAGFGDLFAHRTGHSIGHEVHGNGVNMDNLETKDERQILPGCCFSIEPGIYIEGEMAVRTEINVFVTEEGRVEVTGDIQRELVKIR